MDNWNTELQKGVINMTQYAFKCSYCNYECDFEYDMHSDIAKTHICPKCKKIMKRDYSKISVIIPSYFNPSENPVKFGKRPPGKKKYY